MKLRTLETELWLPQPPEQVFAFFGDAHNLDRITPPWLHFRILTPAPIPMAAGTLIDYTIRLHGLPVRWRTEITEWQPPYRFVDEQRRGPYRRWFHEHIFTPRDGGTHVHDRVRYAVPGGPLEPLLHWLLVGRDLQAIFAYREQAIREHFQAPMHA